MKKAIAALIAAGLLLNTAAVTGFALSAGKGDVTGDQSVDVADVRLLQGYIHGKGGLTVDTAPAADMNDDGVIDVFDLVLLKRAVLNQQAFSQVYEAEDAELSGNNSISNEPGASGGKVVGNFADDSDNLTFHIEVPAAGSYCLTITSKGLGGDKYNEILVDGENVGGFDSKGDVYTDTALRRVMLTAGAHTISIKKSWGWIMIDCLKITMDEAISSNVYDVESKLINPNADESAKELFSYLCESYGKYTLAGQVCNDGMNGPEFKAIYEATGKYPAIVGLDMMDYCPSRVARGARSNAVETAIDFHKQGGIATFCWHWNAPDKYMKSETDANGNPSWWSAFNTSNTNFDIAAVMNGSDPEGKALMDADIAEIAKQLNRLRDAGVPVLWRPLHEASGGWFWWGAKGPDAYKQLWMYLYDQLTNTYGCNNLIWVWNGQAADWYPGDEYVDIIGEDIYAGEHNYGAQNAKFSELLEYSENKKIIAMTENGTVFDIDNVIAANSRWAWFVTWCGGFVEENGRYTETYTEKDIMYKTYNSEYVITLDELPWYQSGTASSDTPSTTPTVTPEQYMDSIRNSIVDRLPAGTANTVSGVDYGEMRSCTYYSTTRERMTNVRVLLPAGYNENETYPVLYMLHGYWNDETTLSDPESGLQTIIGNLIASGEAEKMIVVFPYIYTSKDMPFCTGMDEINNQNYDNFIYDLETDLMPWIESNFSVKTGRENTAISGFSMGARESFYIGVKLSDRFGYVGSVCTAPGLAPGMLAPGDMRFDTMPYMVLISGAVYDGVVGNNPENYHNMLTASGVAHIWNSLPEGGHDNNSIQPHVYNFAKFLFKAQ